jgi:hypothetical protein
MEIVSNERRKHCADTSNSICIDFGLELGD